MEFNKTLVIMAAGLGSRYDSPDEQGNCKIKQLEQVGPDGEIIMDYSIHDAMEAGFNKVVFVIRKDIEKNFREVIGERIEKICSERQVQVGYAFQEMTDLPAGCVCPADRKKPWGTGQAVLAAKELLGEPFVVINADDYYGKEAFVSISRFLDQTAQQGGMDLCMAGFVLKNTLSENGGVTRGICKMDEAGYLKDVVETKNIRKTAQGAEANGKEMDLDSLVSMNMWGLTPEFVKILEQGFVDFLQNNPKDELVTAEFLLPIFIDQLLKKKAVTVKVLDTQDQWFGVTYKEDKPFVMECFRKLLEEGVYQKNIFSDL